MDRSDMANQRNWNGVGQSPDRGLATASMGKDRIISVEHIVRFADRHAERQPIPGRRDSLALDAMFRKPLGNLSCGLV